MKRAWLGTLAVVKLSVCVSAGACQPADRKPTYAGSSSASSVVASGVAYLGSL